MDGIYLDTEQLTHSTADDLLGIDSHDLDAFRQNIVENVEWPLPTKKAFV
jgi:hypothetical protein